MNFTYSERRDNSKMTKVAVVGLLHVALGYALVHSLNTAHIKLPHMNETILTLTPEIIKKEPPPPPPKTPPKPKQEVKPVVEIPKPAVETPPPPEPTVQAEVVEQPSPPAPAAPAADPAPSNAPVGNIGKAVLAEGCATPDYPKNALRMNEEGTTVLALLVGPDGHVQNAKVQSSSGYRDLDKAAEQALSLCKFKPAVANDGQPQAGWARLDYVWKLDS
jgi:protein TonB